MSYSLALGPSERTWRGSQHLILTVEGEQVVDCDYRDDDSDADDAERMARLPFPEALELSGRIDPSCAHAHRLAFCQAVEALAVFAIPERDAALRTLAAEWERAASHIDTLRQVMDILSLAPYSNELLGLHQQVRDAIALFGSPNALAELCVPGGVAYDLAGDAANQLLEIVRDAKSRLFTIIDKLIDRRAFLNATVDIGVLNQAAAESFGVRGPLARGSGVRIDTRLDAPYAFYSSIDTSIIGQEGGDVYARLVVLFLEAFESIKQAEQILASLPSGAWLPTTFDTLPAGEGSAAVESPRGRLAYSIESNGQSLTAVQIDAPRQIDRLLARTLFIGAEIDTIPLIMLSLDASPGRRGI